MSNKWGGPRENSGRPPTRLIVTLQPAMLERLNRHVPIDQRTQYLEVLIRTDLAMREKMNNTLTWNNDTRQYVGQIGNDRIEIDGDVFAETEQEMRAQYVKDGMSEEDAEKKAWAELNDVTVWQTDNDGVTVTPIK